MQNPTAVCQPVPDVVEDIESAAREVSCLFGTKGVLSVIRLILTVFCGSQLLDSAGDGAPQTNLTARLNHLLLAAEPRVAAGEVTPEKYLQQLSESIPQRVCTHAFRQGDLVWNCKTCQVRPVPWRCRLVAADPALRLALADRRHLRGM